MEAKVVVTGGNSPIVPIDIFAQNDGSIRKTYARTQDVNRFGAVKVSQVCRQLVAYRHDRLLRTVVTDKSSQSL